MSGLCRWPAPQVSRSTGQDGSGKEESLERRGGAPPCLEASARIVRSPLRKDARGVPAASRLLETDVAASSRSLIGPPRDARRRAAVTVMPRHRQWRRRALSWQSTVYKDPHQVSATSRAFHLLPSHNNQPPLRSPVTRRPSPCCLCCLPRLLAHVPVTVLRKHRPQYCCPGCEHPAVLWPCSLFHRPVPGTASSCAASGAEKEISKAAIWILTLKIKTTML